MAAPQPDPPLKGPAQPVFLDGYIRAVGAPLPQNLRQWRAAVIGLNEKMKGCAMYLLHYAPDNASLIVRIALLELGVPFETRLVDRSRMEQRSARFLRLNPLGVIPVLETPDGALSETAAILLWLTERHGGLAPDPANPDRGLYLKWLFYVSNTLHADLRLVFYPQTYVGDDLNAQKALHTGATARLTGHLAMLESLCAQGRGWFGGVDASALDIYVAVIMRWAALYARHGVDWFQPQSLPRLMAMAQRLEERDTVRACAIAEGLGPHPFTAPARPSQASPQ